MRCAILTIGDELLIGQVVNTNAAFVAARLADEGIDIARVVTVGDGPEEIGRALGDALADTDAVIMTGGLGPTHDDVTKQVLAEFFGLPLVRDEGLAARIAALLSARGIAWSAAAEEQTMIPRNALLLPNRYGTAAGLLVERDGKIAVALPGVPYEMEQIMTDSVVPILRGKAGGRISVHRTLRTAGIPESALASLLGVPASLPEGVSLAFLPALTGVRLRLDASAAGREEGLRLVAAAEAMIRERAGRYVYGAEAEELEEVVGKLLAATGRTLACAESCTGGAIAKKITSVPGSSAYFLGSVVAYHNRLKEGLIGVDPSVIAAHGAVSRETAVAMAEGIREMTGADIGLAVTGVAGPSGGTPDKPVGTVWLAYADAAGTAAIRQSFGEGRERVTERAAVAALDLLRRKLLRLE